MGNLCCMSWDTLLIHLPWSWYQTAFRSPAVFFFPVQENELKHSVCRNWKMYSGCGHCSLSVCLCVGVWVCVCVCLSVDSGALMLKDVSSFLHCTWLLWRSCWAALMSRMCHCRTFSSETAARGDQNGMFILSISSPSRYFCVTLLLPLILLRRYMHWKVFFVILPSTSTPTIISPGEKSAGFTGKELNTSFTLKGASILLDPAELHFMYFLNSSLWAHPYLIDNVAAAGNLNFLLYLDE